MSTLRHVRSIFVLVLMSAAEVASAQGASGSSSLPPPERFFGHAMGADRKLVGWDALLSYYQLLAKSSDRVRLEVLGKSSEGRPYVALFISSAENLARLDHYRELNARLVDPRGLPEAEAHGVAREGKVVVIQSFGLHASEVAGTQAAAEFAYDSISREDADATRIRDSVISIVMPSINPDGTQMIADWYMKYVGTEHEAARLPWLYQTYAGHDNNRDGFALNLPESRNFARLLYRDWVPEAYVDHHQMGYASARMSIPPYAEPIRPDADPLVWREMALYGAQMGNLLESAGKTGIIGSAIYSGWGHMGFHWITPFHNIAGMLTESASARLATPVFVQPDQLSGGERGLPQYESQVSMPSPWPGGWWHVSDIVSQQKIAAWATVDLAARNRETLLWNMYLKGRHQSERGATGPVKAYVIEAAQHDPPTVKKLINLFLASGVEVQQADARFVADDRLYGAGSFVVTMAQPKQGLVRWVLGRTFYPDNSYTRDSSGNPIQPYDLATDTFGEFMGIRSEPVSQPVSASLVKLTAPLPLTGHVAEAAGGRCLLSTKLNDSFRAVFLLLSAGANVQRVTQGEGFTPGDFIVSDTSPQRLADIVGRAGADCTALPAAPPRSSYTVRKPRVALFQRYEGGNEDEGWTRLMFEQFDVPFQTLRDAGIKKGKLNSQFDIIVIPADSIETLIGEKPEKNAAPKERSAGNTPKEFRSGFGDEGVTALQAFVKGGGTLVTFGEAGNLPLKRFGLPVRDVVAGLPSKEFWCPGSTLRARFDTSHPLAYGMPAEGLVLFMEGQAYGVTSFQRSQDVEPISTYEDRDILQSGWLLGEQVITKKAGAVSVRDGDGRVVLIGFRPQHRAQTHGTFKIVFNALLGAPPQKAPPKN